MLLNLPEEQQAQLADWLLGGMPYYEAQKQVRDQFGVTVKSLKSFTGFWEHVCAGQMVRRRNQACSMAHEIAAEAEKRPALFDQATIDALKQKAFELSISPQAKPKEVKALFMLVLKARDQDLTERKVALLEKKAAQADQAANAVGDQKLSPEEKERRLKQIFGIPA